MPRWKARLAVKTPFGPSDMPIGMARFTWHVFTIVLVAFGVLLILLARDTTSLATILRWLALV